MSAAITAARLEDLHQRLDVVSAILRDTERLGTPRYDKAVLAHRLLTDLIDRRGGAPAERAYAVKKLAEIEAG